MPLSLRRLRHWTWQTITVAPGPFVSNLISSIVVQQLSQAKGAVLMQVAALLTAAVGGAAVSGPEPAASTGGSNPLIQIVSAFTPVTLRVVVIMFVVVAIAAAVAQFADGALSAWSNTVMLARLQKRIHDRLLLLGGDFHERVGLSTARQILTKSATVSQSAMRELVSYPIVAVISFGTAIIYLFGSLRLPGQPAWVPFALIALCVAVPLLAWWTSLGITAAYRRSTMADLAMLKEFENSDMRPIEIQAMGATEQRQKAFGERLTFAVRAKLRAAIRNGMATQFQSAAPDIVLAVILIYVVLAVVQSPSPAGVAAIVGILQFVPAVIAPITQTTSMSNALSSSWPDLAMVIEVFDAEPEIREPVEPHSLPTGPLSVQADSILFQPESSLPPILHDLSVTFTPGKIWGLVGRSGSGKSTFLSLVARLREYQAGSLSLGGTDIRQVGLKSLRRGVGVVTQSPLIISDTVRSNLRLGCADASDAAMIAACRSVKIWDFLPAAKLDTPLEASQGATLSGGQRTLLAVARALLSDPGLLIFDEPTTGLDVATTQIIQEIVRNHARGRTVIIVSHDLGFLAALCDHIACLEEGKISEVVDKADFFTKPSLFLNLYRISQRNSEDHLRPVPIPGVDASSRVRN